MPALYPSIGSWWGKPWVTLHPVFCNATGATQAEEDSSIIMMLVLLNILYFQNILSSSCPRTNVGSNTESDQMPRKGRKVSSFWWTVLGANYVFYGLSSSHVQMWELDHKEDWVPKNWCFWTVVLENTLESPLDCKEILRESHSISSRDLP